MVLWAAFSRDPFMWAWIALWLLCLIRRRIEAVKLAGSGMHSHYDGWPCDAIRYVRSEKAAKLVVEPILVGILGGILFWIYGECGLRPTGLPYFLLSGVFTLPFVETVKQTIWNRRLESMNNSRLEQQAAVRDFKDRYGEF